ncbi:hypothetical protein [Paraburkholderia phymatum]|uniref:hypothetical protein n=1 Tax=Paraburkholderia phymatum TaxID=148447 RepID=UPI0005A1EAE2
MTIDPLRGEKNAWRAAAAGWTRLCGVPIARWITMNRSSGRRSPAALPASASSCCFMPAAISTRRA